MARGDGFDNVQTLGEAIVEFVLFVLRIAFRIVVFVFRVVTLGFARGRATRKARADERASRQQQQKWHEAVERQKARGDADFASEAEARAALRGKGGRPSKLDDRWFE
jgi:hypothetical protein